MTNDRSYLVPRVRSTFGEPIVHNSAIYFYCTKNDQAYYSPERTFTFENSGEAMCDYISTIGPPWPFKAASQFKWDFEWMQNVGRTLPHGNPLCKGDHVDYVYDPHYLYVPESYTYEDLCPVVADWTDYKWEFSQMISQSLEVVDQPTDLLVFLAELRDLASMVRNVCTIWSTLRSVLGANLDDILSGIRIALSASPKGVALGAMNLASESLLSYAFAWRPFISDTLAIANKIAKLQRRYEQLVEGSGKIQKAYSRREVAPPSFSETEVLSSSWCGNQQVDKFCWSGGPSSEIRVTRRIVATQRPNLSTCVAYRYNVPDDFTELSGKFGFLLRAIGISPSAKTVWDLVPFSFVVDWVLPIGPLLGKYLEYDPSRIKTDIVDLCATIKSGRSAKLTYRRQCHTGGAEIPLTFATRYDMQRVVGEQLLHALPSFRFPSSFQLLLGSALAYAVGGGNLLRPPR